MQGYRELANEHTNLKTHRLTTKQTFIHSDFRT